MLRWRLLQLLGGGASSVRCPLRSLVNDRWKPSRGDHMLHLRRAEGEVSAADSFLSSPRADLQPAESVFMLQAPFAAGLHTL